MIAFIIAAAAIGAATALYGVRLLMTPARSLRLAPSKDERTAAHEAGHCVAAWISPRVLQVETVCLLDVEEASGVTRFTRRTERTDAERWDCLVIALAGLAGEAVAFGTMRSSPSTTDLARAREWAETLAGASDAFASCPWSPSSRTSVDIGAMYVERPSPAACRILVAAYCRAKDLIVLRPDKFDALRRAILEHRTLAPEDIEALLGPRSWSLP